jgi:hypothetical protein
MVNPFDFLQLVGKAFFFSFSGPRLILNSLEEAKKLLEVF